MKQLNLLSKLFYKYFPSAWSLTINIFYVINYSIFNYLWLSVTDKRILYLTFLWWLCTKEAGRRIIAQSAKIAQWKHDEAIITNFLAYLG